MGQRPETIDLYMPGGVRRADCLIQGIAGQARNDKGAPKDF
jgi:hypothetical protein